MANVNANQVKKEQTVKKEVKKEVKEEVKKDTKKDSKDNKKIEVLKQEMKIRDWKDGKVLKLIKVVAGDNSTYVVQHNLDLDGIEKVQEFDLRKEAITVFREIRKIENERRRELREMEKQKKSKEKETKAKETENKEKPKESDKAAK